MFQWFPLYFSEECSSKNGQQDGSCAAGFGVCCVCKYETLQKLGLLSKKLHNFKKNLISVLVSCGSTINDNCSYVVQSSFSTGVSNPCTYKVCPVGNNVCRIRYDFTVWFIK